MKLRWLRIEQYIYKYGYIIVGVLLIVLATLKYHKKFNSYLEIKYGIIKK